MSYTQWVSNGTNVSYVPKEKDTGEVITPFTTTAPGGVPNSSYAPSTYVLAASGAWIPQTVGTSSSEVRRPTAYTLLTSNPSPYFEATDTSLVYDSDTNHLTTNGRFELQGLSAQNDASFKFSSFQTKAQTWTSATLNISRNYASTRWTSGTEARYYLSTDGGTNWTLLLTDDYDNDPVTVTIFSHTLATSNPSSLSNYQVKVEIDAFSSGALGSVGVLDLQLYDIWIEGIYTVSGGSGTVTSITTTGANGVTISGGSTQTITTSGTFALALGNITPTSISTGTGSFSGDVEFAASIKSPNGSNSPVTIVPDGTGDLHVNADSLRLGDNNADATIATNGTGDLILTTHEGSATEGVIRLYDGANGNITLTPNGTGQVQVGSDQVVTLTASQTLTNKTLSSNSVWNGNVIGSAYGGAGTVNGILKANGSGTVSAASSGTDYVTSVSVTSPVINTGTTANPTIALASGYGDTQNPYGSKTANYFLASPNGSAGVPTWRSIVAADIPTLNQNTTGTAANVTGIVAVANGGTGLTSLTAGYIPYGNGTSAFGSSANLFWDSANSRLGIGTTTPSQKLEVANGYALFGGLRINGADASVNQIWQSNSGTNLGIMANGGAILFGQTSSEKMRLDASGNLGIGGTASSGTRLYVVGSNTTSNTSIPIYANQVYGNTGVSSAALRLNLNDGAGGCYLYGYSGGAGFMHNAEYLAGTGWTARSTFASIMETTSSGFSFYLNSSLTAGNTFTPSEQMRLTSTGLGIGTSSPSAKLSIYKGSAGVLATLQGGGTACGFAQGVVGGANTFEIQTQDTATGTLATRYLIRGGTDNANHEWYAGARGSEAVKMFLEASTGNVGIGTNTPASKLNVSGGNVTVSAGYGIAWSGDQNRIMTPEDNVSGALIAWASGGICRFLTASTERMRITSTEVKATVPFIGNSGTKGFGSVTTTTSTSTPTGGSSGDHYYIY